MKIFSKSKDGGPESTVTGYFLCEIKSLFSIVLLKFEGKSREAYHTHAFNCISWVLKGKLTEKLAHKYSSESWPNWIVNEYTPSVKPIITKRETYHKVDSDGVTWVFSFRGPWSKTWKEYLVKEDKEITLSNGRIEVD